MRYKFRGKQVCNDDWVYGYFYEYLFVGKKISVISDINGNWCPVDPETVGQLVAVEGREFHEGDRLKFQYYKDFGQSGEYIERHAVVKWNDRLAGFEPFIHWNSYNYEMGKVEIIGTIYDLGEVKA